MSPKSPSKTPPALLGAGRTTRARLLAILLACGKPLKGRAVASRAGLKMNGHTRAVLASLVIEGAVARTSRGYAVTPSGPGARAG